MGLECALSLSLSLSLSTLSLSLSHHCVWLSQPTTWGMAAEIGFSSSPQFYGLQNDLRQLAAITRRERQSVAPGVDVLPWVTNGETGGSYSA